jgi:hypothetical protein
MDRGLVDGPVVLFSIPEVNIGRALPNITPIIWNVMLWVLRHEREAMVVRDLGHIGFRLPNKSRKASRGQ